MVFVPKTRLARDAKIPSRSARSRGFRRAERICLYGWDSRAEIWHGPTELGVSSVADKRLLEALRAAPGKSWYGAVSCVSPGARAARFFALVHDLSDCAVASIYCDESKAGPAEIIAVIPAHRRSHLRNDFAFEFLAFAHFLGALSTGAELKVHDAIASAITEQGPNGTMVFSISSGLWPSDLDLALSFCVEKVAVTLSQWLGGSPARRRHACNTAGATATA